MQKSHISGNLPDFCELVIIYIEVDGSRLFSPERGQRIVKRGESKELTFNKILVRVIALGK